VREDIYSAFSPTNVAFFDFYKADKNRRQTEAAAAAATPLGAGPSAATGGNDTRPIADAQAGLTRARSQVQQQEAANAAAAGAGKGGGAGSAHSSYLIDSLLGGDEKQGQNAAAGVAVGAGGDSQGAGQAPRMVPSSPAGRRIVAMGSRLADLLGINK
jgi:hypothetical protein